MSEADINDRIANNRTLPVTKAETIPVPDSRYRPTTPEARAARLKKVAKNQEAELIHALKECAELGARVKALLGEFAPEGSEAEPIANELAEVKASLAKLYELAAYLEEKRMILLSDGRAYIDAVQRELDHRLDRQGGLSSTFHGTIRFTDGIGAAISEGMAEAKKKKL